MLFLDHYFFIIPAKCCVCFDENIYSFYMRQSSFKLFLKKKKIMAVSFFYVVIKYLKKATCTLSWIVFDQTVFYTSLARMNQAPFTLVWQEKERMSKITFLLFFFLFLRITITTLFFTQNDNPIIQRNKNITFFANGLCINALQKQSIEFVHFDEKSALFNHLE